MHNAHAMVSSVAVFAQNPGQNTCLVEARFHVLQLWRTFGNPAENTIKLRHFACCLDY